MIKKENMHMEMKFATNIAPAVDEDEDEKKGTISQRSMSPSIS